MITRAATILFAVLMAALCCYAAAELYLYGRLPEISPLLLGFVGVAGTGLLLAAILGSRAYAQYLEGRADRLSQLTKELESVITALEAANARLNASEARYKGLVDAQGDAILRRTPDGRITYANEAFFKLFGVRPDQVIGQVFHPEIHPQSPPPMLGRLAGREVGRERVSYDQHVKTVAGYRWIAWEDYAIRNAEGRLCEMQSVGRDITERKRLEAALTVARDKAEETNRAKSRFLATMSHEIRTPMNGVLGMARLLLETALKADQKSYAEAIKQSGLSLLALIEDILDFSKIESGALVLEKSDVSLRPLVEGIAELLATRAHSRGIEICTAIAPDVPDLIRADGIRLRQVLTNLVGNAVKFTEEGGVLVAVSLERASPEETTLRFSVRDTGIGVPEDKQKQIFEDFVQADSSHARRFEGTGLGLSISKRLVEAMGGKIGMMSAKSKGSIFWVTVPLETVAALPQRERPLAGKNVMIVSPSAILRAGLRLQLQAAGIEAGEARSINALSRLRRPMDLVLIDAPAADEQPLPDVTNFFPPTVALIPPTQRGRLDEIGAKGLHGYLMKPVRQESLEKRLEAVFEGRVEIEPPVVQPEPARHHGGGLDILLAEDNPVNALLARELLRRRGHIVTEVTTGEAAVLACAKRSFDLVIMDLHMPGCDGIEATRRIRLAESNGSMRAVPIFALTADALETGRKACLVAGMDGFLTKPVDPAELDSVLATIVPPAVIAAE